jgi:hypothetical protein
MKPTDHCELCYHQKVDFTHGSYCGITDKKPQFKIACPKVKFKTVARQKVYKTLFFLI